jgi:hypothetical protein
MVLHANDVAGDQTAQTMAEWHHVKPQVRDEANCAMSHTLSAYGAPRGVPTSRGAVLTCNGRRIAYTATRPPSTGRSIPVI